MKKKKMGHISYEHAGPGHDKGPLAENTTIPHPAHAKSPKTHLGYKGKAVEPKIGNTYGHGHTEHKGKK